MTLAFNRRAVARVIDAPEPVGERELTRQRLARLQRATVARPPAVSPAGPAGSFAGGVEAAPWKQARFSIGRSIAWKPVAAVAAVLLAVVVITYTGRQHRATAPVPSSAIAAEAPVDPARGEQPLPQDLAGMTAAPAVAPREAPAAVLKALSALSPAVAEPALSAPVSSEPASAENTAGWARSDAFGYAAVPASRAPASGWARSQELQQGVPPQPPGLIARQSASQPQASQAVITWPAAGPLTSLYGPTHPLGIDIGLPFWTPLRAAAAGRVTFTGGDPCCSYGYFIDIDHGNGVMTRYGHLGQPSPLRPGQFVRLGDFIGYSGSTGYSTGPHLHFEIRLYGRPVDPLLVLP